MVRPNVMKIVQHAKKGYTYNTVYLYSVEIPLDVSLFELYQLTEWL